MCAKESKHNGRSEKREKNPYGPSSGKDFLGKRDFQDTKDLNMEKKNVL